MSKQWQELRARNIGGSEIAALFGKSPWTTEFKLWHEKHGLIVADEISNERADAGKFLEPAIIAWANHKWGLDLFTAGIYVEHAEIKGMGCTPDAFSVGDSRLMAQIKNVDSLQFSLKWETEGETVTKAPLDILLQVQHEMEVCDKDRSYLIVCVGGNRLYFMLCERDRRTGYIIKRTVDNFWNIKEPPNPDFQRDYDTIRILRQNLPVTDYEDLSEDADLHRTLRRAQKLRKEIKKREDEYGAIKAEILYAAKQYEGFTCKNFTVKFNKNGTLNLNDKEIRA